MNVFTGESVGVPEPVPDDSCAWPRDISSTSSCSVQDPVQVCFGRSQQQADVDLHFWFWIYSKSRLYDDHLGKTLKAPCAKEQGKNIYTTVQYETSTGYRLNSALGRGLTHSRNFFLQKTKILSATKREGLQYNHEKQVLSCNDHDFSISSHSNIFEDIYRGNYFKVFILCFLNHPASQVCL